MTIAEILRKMIAYSNGNTHDIDHLIRVWTYAKNIGELEGIDKDTHLSLKLLQSSMILHVLFAVRSMEIQTENIRRKKVFH